MSYTLFETNMWKAVDINNSKCRVPHDWHLQKVSDLAYHITTGKKDANAAIENGIYPFYTCGEKNLAINEYSFDTNALVLNGNGAVGDVKMAAGKFDAYQRNYVLTGGLPLKYSYYVFKKFFKHAVHLSGSVMPYITLKDLQKFEIRIPPLPEQTAIANILSDQEALIAQYDNLIALHEKRFAYLSDELLSGRLRLNVDGIASSNENWQMVSVNGDLVEIPADWETKKLGQTLTCLDSKRKPLNSKERASQKGLVPYWGANSIVDFVSGYLLDEDVVLLGEDAAPFFDKSKRVAFASHGKIWPNNHVHVLKPKDIDFSYAVYVLNQLPYEQIIGVTVRPKLTQSRMLDIDLVMPSRLEQALIAQVLSDQEALIAQYKKLRAAEKKRFDWLSDALLSGTYRVKVEA